MNTEEFIERAKLKHGEKYDYSKVEYINSKTKVCIICPIHGEFHVLPIKHITRGDGCIKCSGKEKYTTEKFILKSKEIHNNTYYYDKTMYINNKTKLIVTCPIHGDFEITPNKHLNGQGCPKCRYIKSASSKRRSLSEVIKLANNVHNNKYDYSLIKEYKNDRIKYQIICPIHGIFEQTMNNHIIFKNGCPKCAIINNSENRKYNVNEWIHKANAKHNNRYDYSKVEYVDSKTKVCIICPTHGEFYQTPSNHLYGQGCPICRQSKLENLVENLLIENNIEYQKQKKFEWLKNKRNLALDFYLPKYNIAIECQGKQHFNENNFGNETNEVIIYRDKKKHELCVKNGVKLLYFSNLGINYPYHVIENEDELLKEILNG